MSDVKQAAERLRRWKQDVFTCNMEQVGKDRALLAEAYLAEHLPDDDEPITEEWWDSLNEVYAMDTDNDIAVGDYFVCFNQEWQPVDCVSVVTTYDEMDFPHIKTRGQLRLLLRALTPERGQP